MPRYANPDPMNSQKQDRCGSVLIFLGSYVICHMCWFLSATPASSCGLCCCCCPWWRGAMRNLRVTLKSTWPPSRAAASALATAMLMPAVPRRSHRVPLPSPSACWSGHLWETPAIRKCGEDIAPWSVRGIPIALQGANVAFWTWVLRRIAGVRWIWWPGTIHTWSPKMSWRACAPIASKLARAQLRAWSPWSWDFPSLWPWTYCRNGASDLLLAGRIRIYKVERTVGDVAWEIGVIPASSKLVLTANGCAAVQQQQSGNIRGFQSQSKIIWKSVRAPLSSKPGLSSSREVGAEW